MYPGFPRDLLPLLRCPNDGGTLEINGPTHSADHVGDAMLACARCGTGFAIENGIVRLLDTSKLDPDSERERAHRDRGASAQTRWEDTEWGQKEIRPTLAALGPLAGTTVLEFGCGAGRYTIPMARAAAVVLAVDFSLGALQKLASAAEPHWRLGLVQADCTKLAVRKRAFERALSTLVSNLPSARHRDAMLRNAAEALAANGKFVFSAHHFGLRERVKGVSQAGLYSSDGIFRYLFRRDEITEETARHFGKVRCRPIQIRPPFMGRLGMAGVALPRFAERIPLLNQLADLLLVVAEHPP